MGVKVDELVPHESDGPGSSAHCSSKAMVGDTPDDFLSCEDRDVCT